MDDANVVAYTTLTDQYLKRFGAFVENHFSSLIRSVSEDISDSSGSDGGVHHGSEFNFSEGAGRHIRKDLNSETDVSLHASSRHILDFLRHPIRTHWTSTVESATFEELTCIPHPIDGNPDVQKVMLVLVTITYQARSFKETGFTNFINSIVLYGDVYESGGMEKDTASVAEAEGDGHVSISKLLPTLLELLEFIKDCTDFANHWISQIAALFKESKPHVVTIANLQLYTVFKEFGDLLGLLVVLDEVIRNQTVLQEHWLKYRQMIKSVRADSRSFDTEVGNLVSLERNLIQLDKFVLSANIFKNFLDTVLHQNQRTLSRNVLLAEKFNTFLSTLQADLDKEVSFDNYEYKPISLAAMYVFTSSLFPNSFDSKKTFQKTMWEQLRKIQAVALPGVNVWMPEVFLNNCVQGNGTRIFDGRAMQLVKSARHTFLQQRVASLAKDIFHWNLIYSSWTIKLQEVLLLKELSSINMSDLSRKCTLIVDGIKLAQNLSHTFKLILNLHASLGHPIGKNTVLQLCQILEILKSIQGTFFQYSVKLCYSTMYIIQHVMHTALVKVRNLQKLIINVQDVRRAEEAKADSLSVLKILEHCLRGTLTQKRFLASQIAMDWVCSSNSVSRHFKDEDTLLILPACFERISQLIEMDKNIERYCNGSSVFFHRVIFSTYFSSIYAQPHESSKLVLIFLIIRDCLSYLQCSPHSERAGQIFMMEIESYLKTHFVERLCQDVETDLRILSHTHLQTQDVDGVPLPFRVGVKEVETILEIPSFPFNNTRSISFKNVVEHYISKTFYNLASVALHDWQSYATMRALASDKYKLSILDDHLPGHSLEQGRDILEIVRDLPHFVREFTYNLNNQVFVQINSPNKHLDTVNIRHLANSLRTHGPGMANTTVNFTYKFLRSKIPSLSQFLYDEQIKSRLAKDIKLVKQSHQESASPLVQNLAYATLLYERATKFSKGIRKVSLTADGLSPLDQLRILITHIGNALGFVRLVRSGGSHFLAGGYQFVPDLQDLTDFTDLVESSQEANYSPWASELKLAASGIDSAIKTLSTSFSDGVDYFKLLVNAFQPALLDTRNSHLKSFYGIIPALTLSYVDHIRVSKEKLAKKSKTSTMFTDDGFSMGIAYLLKVLNQGNDFDMLSWFSSVEFYLTHQRETALKAIQASRKDEKLQQTNTLTAKRLLDQLQEFQLVRYNLSSARIFFHTDVDVPSYSSSTAKNTNKR